MLDHNIKQSPLKGMLGMGGGISFGFGGSGGSGGSSMSGNLNLVDSPSISYTNNSILSGSSNTIWVWNNGKGLFVTSSDIFTEGSSNSKNSSNTGNRSASTTTFTIPDGLAWIYAVVIGGGGGGSSDYPPRPGGGGGGACFAKIDLRQRLNQTITLTSGAGGNTSSDGGDSILSIDGTTFLTGGRGYGGNYSQGSGSNASGGPGGTYVISSDSDIIYSYGLNGGKGGGNVGTAENGFNGACGGGGCSNGTTFDNGGQGQFLWGGGGAGADGASGIGGQHLVNYLDSSIYDNDRGASPISSESKEFSLVSGITFFGDSTSSTAFDGRNGTTSSQPAPAGYFGSGGGGSQSGSGSPGGPGAVIIWWD